MTTILTKKKDTAGAPVAGDLTNAAGGAELAVNTATKRLYTKDSGGNVVEIGTNPSTIDTTTVDTTNLEVTNIKAKDGTASIVLADTTGIATFSKATVVETTDNTNAALRITQLGTGNALLVEDNTNPDSSPFVISNNGSVIVGKDSALTNYKVDISTTGEPFSTAKFVNSTAASLHLFAKSRSTTPGTYSILSSGDGIASLNFAGDDGTAFITAASITAAVDGTPGTSDMPGRLVFSTTADGASTPTERMRIDQAGRIGVGTTSLIGYRVRVAGVFETTGTTGLAIAAETTIPSNVTGNAYGFYSAINTAASAFTLGILHHYRAVGQTPGAGSTVTSQFGFHADSGLTGATNNYGFYGNIAAASGRYNFYAAGTADNYFAGNVGVGTTSPTSMLQTAGTSAKSAFKTPNIAEVATVSAIAATGTINYDVTTQSVLYYTTDASGNFTVNFRGSSGTSLNTIMATGESLSATFLVTNGATAYYNSAVEVDGSSVIPKWQGGSAPTSGNASSIDSYTYVIIKTGSATFTVLASVTKFA